MGLLMSMSIRLTMDTSILNPTAMVTTFMGHGYGKRSAEAEPGYGYGGYSSVYRSTEGLTGGYGGHGRYGGYGYHKRAAEPGYGYATSYDYRIQGLQGHHGYGYGYHKRDAEPGYGYGATAYHPYGGYSSVYRSTEGLTGGYGGYGYHKRSAEPGYHGSGYSYVHQSRPYHHGDYGYDIHHSYHPGYGYGKRSAEPGYYGHSYGTANSYQHVSRYNSDYGIEVYHPY